MKDLSPLLTRPSPAFYLISAALYMGFIYFLSSVQIPIEESAHPQLWSYMGNLFHFPLYAGLGCLLLLGFRTRNKEAGAHLETRTLVLALLILAAYGAFDEYHQSWSGRTPSVIDFIMDLNGGLLAVLALKLILDKSLSPGRFLTLFVLLSVLALLLASASTFM